MIFQGHLKKKCLQVKNKVKTPKVAVMLHFNYQINRSARICNPKKNATYAVKVF
jgi:hypothetical protein